MATQFAIDANQDIISNLQLDNKELSLRLMQLQKVSVIIELVIHRMLNNKRRLDDQSMVIHTLKEGW